MADVGDCQIWPAHLFMDNDAPAQDERVAGGEPNGEIGRNQRLGELPG